ncbi:MULTISPECIES: OstA-like protein [unclassified Flavobacterium]|uniref:OstA-like protein n=1 Tax=unclassified Flavobacterium TaxID=196869 RepID=UPI001F1311BB|nr:MULTISPECIES: OstA-like protein [unclassified Flavobacterium]UMY64481.1 OstA-like protein [Flavobacterium sp. HJ-32-4]
MRNRVFLVLFACLAAWSVAAQKGKLIVVEQADHFDIDEVNMPGAALLTGHVRVSHEGAVMTCNKAYFFKNENYLKAFGEVQLVQGDTLYLNSEYAEYNGNVKMAFATGHPVMRSPDMTLRTDTIHFDRNKQEAYYNSPGTIVNKENTLKSQSGRYYAREKKTRFLTAVTVTNPKYVLKSNHLDYYNNAGHAYLFGPSTITGTNGDFIYTEKGFFDNRRNVGHFLNKSYIKYKDRRIEGDSLYYDRAREFASATRNVKITDTINKGVARGHYAEVYKQKDSMFITKRAVVVSFVDNDSVYVHGKRILVTGKPGSRVVRAWPNARYFKTDLTGKCDSIHSDEKTSLTKLIGKPVMWNGENQLTGDVMHLIGNNETQKLDSLKVLQNTFIISKDSAGTGYNQVKGIFLYGKFKDNKLHEADVVKNAEILYYMRNDDDRLIGINKSFCSRINLQLVDNKVDEITQYDKPDSDLYPEKDLPENARLLKGFVWRGDEMIRTKDDIFPPEENEIDAAMQAAKKKDDAKADTPMKVRKETKDYDKNHPGEKKVPAVN